jgi:hypothetical protein
MDREGFDASDSGRQALRDLDMRTRTGMEGQGLRTGIDAGISKAE